MTRLGLMTSCFALAMTLATRERADACSRVQSPFEITDVGVAVADVVVSAEALAVADGVARLRIDKVYKGGLVTAREITVNGPRTQAEAPMSPLCGVPVMEVGHHYVMLLWSPTTPDGAFTLVDAAGGFREESAEYAGAIRRALVAGHPASAWHDDGAMRTRLVVAPNPRGPTDGELDLLVVVRNSGAVPLKFAYTSWPEASQSRCTLSIRAVADDRGVVATPVPIAPADIAAYFSAHGNHYELEVPVGDATLIRLDRVTTAAPGWGYKERLGFRYYPVESPGNYRVGATCERFFGPDSRLTTEPLTLGL